MKRLILCLIAAIMLYSCNSSEYKFNYTVVVRYQDNTIDTIQGSKAIVTVAPETQTFTISSMLRMKPCLTFGFPSGNIACDVKSFSVKELTYTKL